MEIDDINREKPNTKKLHILICIALGTGVGVSLGLIFGGDQGLVFGSVAGAVLGYLFYISKLNQNGS